MNFRFWHVFISRFLNFKQPTGTLFESCCFSRSGGLQIDVFGALQQKMLSPPCFSILYSYHFPSCTSQCYSLSTVENEVNTPALLIITSFTSDSSVLRCSMLRFYISPLFTRASSFSFLHFIMMLLQKEQGCQLSGLNWCIYSNAIKKFYLSRCYSCSCVFVFISFCTADARSLVNFAT